MELTGQHFGGAALTLAVIVGIGIWSGRRVKNAADFTTGGRRATPLLVMGTITGTLVGGSATIGTAQLAFNFGLSAWWFTLGSGIACLILALYFVNPLRATGSDTIQQMISKVYGSAAGVVTSILGTLGLLINIISQLLSFIAVITSVTKAEPLVGALLGVTLMLCYVVFGGVLGAGILGVVKLTLLYIAVGTGGMMALRLSGGWQAIYATLPHASYFNLFARGFTLDAGAGLSLVLGVLSTQTYVQAVLSARDDASARRGALLSALIIPPIGIFCILIGEYMAMVYPQLNPALALPMFVLQQFPPLAAGVILATLLIAVTGTGAGLALGFATTLTNNIYLKYINKQASSRITLVVMRLLIIIALGGAVFFTMGNLRSVILAWGFLSMALRGAVLFIPLCAALFVKERVAPPFVIASSVIGLATVVVGEFIFPPYLDSLFMGVLAAAVTVGLGMARQGNKPQTPTPGASARRPQV